MTDRDFAFWLAEELHRLVEPLEEGVRTKESFLALLERYGWRPPPGSFDTADIRDAFDLTDDISAGTLLIGQLMSPSSGDIPLATYADLVITFTRVADKARRLSQRPRPAGLPQELWTTFGRDLLPGLVADYLESYRPLLFALLLLAGVVDEEVVDAGGAPNRVRYVRRRMRWSRLEKALTDPKELAREVYGWDDPNGPLRFEVLFDRLHRAVGLLGLPAVAGPPDAALTAAYYAPTNPSLPRVRELRVLLMAGEDERGELFQYALGVLPVPPVGSPAQPPDGLVLAPSFFLGAQPSGLLWPFTLEFGGVLQTEGGVRLELEPGRAAVETGAPGTTVDASFAVIFDAPNPQILVGTPFSHRLQLHGWSIGVEISGPVDDPELLLELCLRKLELVVVVPDNDPFLRQMFGDEIGAGPRTSTLDASLVWSSKTGLHFRGQAALELVIPLDLKLGPIRLDALTLGVAATDEQTSFIIALTAFGRFGPVTLVIVNVGLRFVLVPVPENQPAGALGDLDLDFGFKFPDGVGLAIDAGPVKGGGFLRFDEANGRYGGALEVVIGKLAVKGFGLLTQRPDGFSLIVVLSAEFPEPINLPFGWQLSGVGGLLGLHHRLDAGALQRGLHSGVAAQLLFPSDPIGAAPRILSTLAAVFPPARGQFLVGPLLRLFWGARGLATLSVALILESPDPTRVLILGRLDVTAPHKGFELLVLRAEFAGIIDFERPAFEFDASIVDSRLGPYALSGDIAVRFRGGEGGLFLITAGGFHPQFPVPTNANLPPLRRVAVALSSGDNPRARLEMYTAVTASTWQIGGKLEVSARAAGFTAESRLSVDAIFGEIHENGRTRCGFVVEIEGRAAIRRGGTTIAGVDLKITLTGTEPWHVKGKAKISFFFFSVSIPFEGTFGDEPDRPAIPLVDAGALLRTALTERSAWETGLPSNAGPLVTIAGRTVDADVIVAHPLGRVAVRQSAVPLEVDLARVGGARATPDRFQVTSVRVASETPPSTPLRSPFAAGQYLDLTEDERFTRPAFEPMVSGFEVTSAKTTLGPATAADLRYEEIVVGPDGPLEEPKPDRPPLIKVFSHAALLGAAATSTLRLDERPARQRAEAAAVKVNDVAPVVADAGTLRPVSFPGLARAATFTEVSQLLDRHVASGAAAADSLVLIGAHEAVPA